MTGQQERKWKVWKSHFLLFKPQAKRHLEKKNISLGTRIADLPHYDFFFSSTFYSFSYFFPSLSL